MDAAAELHVRLEAALLEIERLRAQVALMQRREADARLVDAIDS